MKLLVLIGTNLYMINVFKIYYDDGIISILLVYEENCNFAILLLNIIRFLLLHNNNYYQ